MNQEFINKVEILESGELILILESGGNPSYQYIYREAAGVYWDENRHGFKSTIPQDMSYPNWFKHIIKIAGWCNIELKLSNHVVWQNVPEQTKNEILNSHAI